MSTQFFTELIIWYDLTELSQRTPCFLESRLVPRYWQPTEIVRQLMRAWVERNGVNVLRIHRRNYVYTGDIRFGGEWECQHDAAVRNKHGHPDIARKDT